MDNKDEDAISSDRQPEEEQLDLDPDTLGYAEATQDTASSPDFYEEEEYVDWDEPDRDTSTGGSFALNESPEYFDEEEELEDYPSAIDEYPESDDEPDTSADEETGAGLTPLPSTNFEASTQTLSDLDDIEIKGARATANADSAWPEEEGEEFEGDRRLPMGLVIVGVIALILLIIGGYGVVQERSELEEEVRKLQAGLATRADPELLIVAGDRVDALEQEKEQLKAENEELNEEYRLLSSTVAQLQVQLKEQRAQEQEKQEQLKQEQLNRQQKAAAPKAAPQQAAAPEPEVQEPAAPQVTALPVAEGDWFVNFGSYSLRETALNWSKRLQPGAGKVIVAPANSGDRTVYRVRVVNLASKEEAARVARRLEQEHGLDKLWVGRQS